MKNNSYNPEGVELSEGQEKTKHIKKACLRLLTRRDHSRKEIQDKLAIKGYDRSEVAVVVDDLARQSWQDNTRYAESYARVKSQKGFGPVRIAYDLRQQGVEAETIDGIIRSMAENWLVILQDVYAKKYSTPAIIDNSEKAKRIRFLLQRGFSSAMINTLFD